MKTRVAVIYGGRSGEHEISLRSAQAVMEALDPERFKVLQFFISPEGKWRPRPILPEPGGNAEIDVVFPVLHGTFGEDGTVQGLLELADLPYVGPGVFASAAAMDKELFKIICRERDLPVVDWVTLYHDNLDVSLVPEDLGYPLFVKPANLGSSVGISKVKSAAELLPALELAAQYDTKIIVERGITGRELECAVLGNEVPETSFPCEILPSREFYDYEDKYLLDRAQTVLPADLGEAKTAELRALAADAYRALQCAGMSRVDFLLEAATGQLYLNEINTIPGFTSISMYPKMWAHAGVPFPALVERLLTLAQERHAVKRKLRFSR